MVIKHWVHWHPFVTHWRMATAEPLWVRHNAPAFWVYLAFVAMFVHLIQMPAYVLLRQM